MPQTADSGFPAGVAAPAVRALRAAGFTTLDDLAPGGGWNPRYLEIRGTADALTDVEPPRSGFSRELIKIHPDWVRSFGLPDPD